MFVPSFIVRHPILVYGALLGLGGASHVIMFWMVVVCLLVPLL